MSATEILPNIWLGNWKCLKDSAFLKGKNIQVIFNCSRNIPFPKGYEGEKGIRIDVDDSLQQADIQRLTLFLEPAAKKIAHYYAQSKPILIHCYAGKQRSATILAAFIMRYTKLNAITTIKLIQSKRPNAFQPGINFRESLLEFEKKFGEDQFEAL